ncbi:MAG TPA: HIT domain-containing protein [Solirubrobacteraceae bacterium]|jgi:diadenosine tetraphosphate (Ap4A) HIT family hydrolase|nr:HIT domain-containing protein [Solirubrobacteraceae bacterium]
MSACDICQELEGLPGAEFLCRSGPGEQRALRVGEDVAVMPSLGPLAELHALVLPAIHVLSSSAAANDAREAVWEVAQDLRRAAMLAGHTTVIFEHGQSRDGGGCGVSHAHVHVLGTPEPVQLTLPAGRWRCYSGSLGHRQIDPSREHLVISLEPSAWALRYEDGVPSQYLRRWVAAEFDEAQWDWRQPSLGDRNLRMQLRLIDGLMGGGLLSVV